MRGFLSYVAGCALVCGLYVLQPGPWIAIPLCFAFPLAVILLPAKGRR